MDQRPNYKQLYFLVQLKKISFNISFSQQVGLNHFRAGNSFSRKLGMVELAGSLITILLCGNIWPNTLPAKKVSKLRFCLKHIVQRIRSPEMQRSVDYLYFRWKYTSNLQVLAFHVICYSWQFCTIQVFYILALIENEYLLGQHISSSVLMQEWMWGIIN